MVMTPGKVEIPPKAAVFPSIATTAGLSSRPVVAKTSESVGILSKQAVTPSTSLLKPVFEREVLETQLESPQFGRLWQELSGVLPPYRPDEVS